MEDITEKFNAVRAQRIPPEKLAQINKQKSVQFKASLAITIGFFFWLTLLHGSGTYFFTKGFLLTRLVLEQKSTCDSPPIKVRAHDTGCWHPQAYEKAVVIIIDALRYDFTVPRPGSTHHAHNAFKVLHETAINEPNRAFLLPFIADPPTATMQRLKGLTTGTLPTFIDAGSNFAGTAIEEDNVVAQLRDAGRTLVHLGDDTWHSLFPGYFDTNLTKAYDSFNVWDLYTVDNGVTEHLIPLLDGTKEGKWDVIFGHYLGVDHAGHRYGPDHPTTHSKLEEMDRVIRQVVDLLDDDTLLVVMGDHGMDVKGDHGGESDDEVEAALWMYSKKGTFGRGHNGAKAPPTTAKERPVGQIDLVPTLSLLLGTPIPFNNLGAPIAEAFVGSGKPDWVNLATVNALASAQISSYQRAYSSARGLDQSTFSSSKQPLSDGFGMWHVANGQQSRHEHFRGAYELLATYQKETLKTCRSLWARFDIPSMIVGVVILGCSLAILAFFARTPSLAGPASVTLYLSHMSVAGAASCLISLVSSTVLLRSWSINAALGGLAFGGIGGFAVAFFRLPVEKILPCPSSVWGWMAFVMTVTQSGGFAANSFTIWEDDILLLFLLTFAVTASISSIQRERQSDRYLGVAQSLTFGITILVSSFSRLCREEQMPYCKSTYYASTTSSTSAPWQLLIPLLAATLLPPTLKAYFQQTSSYEGIASVWIGFGLRSGLVAVSAFWILDAADDNDWLTVSATALKTTKVVLSRFILGATLIGGTSAWIYSKPCISIRVAQKYDDEGALVDPKAVQIYGSSNAHGTRYFLLISNILIALCLLQKPMGIGALALLGLQILALAEIIHINDLSDNAIGPVILAMLGNFHFFKTGHQAVPSSIQWESAFIPFTTLSYPFSPLLVVVNAFGAQILTALAVPLVVIWKKPSREVGLLRNVSKALATFLLYHATINLATTMWAGHLRRHLMLYRIFSPRFMTGAVVLLLVDLVVVGASLVAFWINMHSIAEVFGWP